MKTIYEMPATALPAREEADLWRSRAAQREPEGGHRYPAHVEPLDCWQPIGDVVVIVLRGL